MLTDINKEMPYNIYVTPNGIWMCDRIVDKVYLWEGDSKECIDLGDCTHGNRLPV